MCDLFNGRRNWMVNDIWIFFKTPYWSFWKTFPWRNEVKSCGNYYTSSGNPVLKFVDVSLWIIANTSKNIASFSLSFYKTWFQIDAKLLKNPALQPLKIAMTCNLRKKLVWVSWGWNQLCEHFQGKSDIAFYFNLF